MKLSLLISLFMISTSVHAQGFQPTWTIKLNSKLLLSTSTESETLNVRKVKASEWKKNCYLEIRFKEAAPSGWNRSVILFDENDNQLLEKDSATYYKIPVVQLRELFAGKKLVRIYSVTTPTNPKIMVRIRRVHLCTLQLL